ncbi:MAG: hypothetical protein R3E79_22945 [Caldilineaceae bacterium]
MTINIDENQLITQHGMTIPWEEIVAVHAAKYDLIERQLTIMTFEHVSGAFVEIAEDEDGFAALKAQLGNHLPLPANWFDRLTALTTSDAITLFERNLDSPGSN